MMGGLGGDTWTTFVSIVSVQEPQQQKQQPEGDPQDSTPGAANSPTLEEDCGPNEPLPIPLP